MMDTMNNSAGSLKPETEPISIENTDIPALREMLKGLQADIEATDKKILDNKKKPE
jgi:hypothetical protein